MYVCVLYVRKKGSEGSPVPEKVATSFLPFHLLFKHSYREIYAEEQDMMRK